MKQKTVSLLFLALLSLIPEVQAENPTAKEYGIILNLSGKQRMLTQKMSKEVFLIALRIDKEENLKLLKNTSQLFDTTLNGLWNGSEELKLPPTTNTTIIKQIEKVEELWTPFYRVIKEVFQHQKVTINNLKYIASHNPPLLKEMNKCVKMYEIDASKAGMSTAPRLATAINLSGRQRMLTQKMTKEYLLIANGYETQDNIDNLNQTTSLFDKTLKGLLNGDASLNLERTENSKIHDQLLKVQELWSGFSPLINEAKKEDSKLSRQHMYQVAKLNLPLLNEMNKAVKMYETEAAKVEN